MPIGPGKLDHWCTLVREGEQARGVIVITFDGTNGGGFSAQADPAMTLAMPDMLEQIAAEMRASFKAGKV